MKILWFNWKDCNHPVAGGAEIVNEELAKRLAKDGHEIIFITSSVKGLPAEESRDGFRIVRVGGKFSVYFYAYQYYKNHLKEWPDVVIDEMNTVPFFTKFYVKQKKYLFVHQLCREVWFYQMIFPFSLIGYLLEPLYLRLISDMEVITISDSTKADLIRFGFKSKKIHIISEGIDFDPIDSVDNIQKFDKPTILSIGSVRPMKRTLHTIMAFNLVKKQIKDTRLIIAGDYSGEYGNRVIKEISSSEYKNDISLLGRISKEEKIELLQKTHLITVTSIKEGWGLVVTEANSQGAPAVVYDVDGLRDSVKNNVTGIVTKKNNPENLAWEVSRILENKELYSKLQFNALEWSREVNFNNSYYQFLNTINHG